MTPAWLAAAAAGAAVACLLPAQSPVQDARRRRVLPLAGLLLIGAALPVPVATLGVAAAAVAAGGAVLWRRRTQRQQAVRTAASLVEVCEQLAAGLGSGQPPGRALVEAAAQWAVLEPVAEAARVGADVPAALRRAALVPGAHGLWWVAAAWQVAHRTGQGLAAAVDRVAVDLRAEQVTRRVVDGELASARATARLVALLPLAALAMGSGVGGDPWGFLLGTPLGLVCLAAGLAIGWLGLWWIEAIVRAVEAP